MLKDGIKRESIELKIHIVWYKRFSKLIQIASILETVIKHVVILWLFYTFQTLKLENALCHSQKYIKCVK